MSLITRGYGRGDTILTRGLGRVGAVILESIGRIIQALRPGTPDIVSAGKSYHRGAEK